MRDRNLIIDWILMAVAILIAAVVIFTHSRETFGAGGFTVADGDFGKSLGGGFSVKYDESPKPRKIAFGPSKIELPIITMRTASWCGVCQAAKTAILESSCYRLIEVDGSSDASIPSFSWITSNGNKGGFGGWHGIRHLISQYNQSTGVADKSASTVRPSTQYYSSNSGAHWTHPGSISSHLRNTHGVNPSGLSHEQQLSLHDSLHESGRGVVRHRKRNR